MGFLQFAVARLLATPNLPPAGREVASFLTLAGTLVYAAGYVSLATAFPLVHLIPMGAALNLAGFAVLAGAVFRAGGDLAGRTVVLVFCLGMTVDLLVGVFDVAPGLTPSGLGPEDGVHQRMLRLARVAATALSVLVLLFPAADGRPQAVPWARRGLLGLVVGCVGMPAILVAASLGEVRFKYLLPVPALAATFGVLAAVGLTWRRTRPLEVWGWALIALSLNVGLLIGLYAFDGPLPAPPTQEIYNGLDRRLVRLGHAYAIVLGLLAVLAARLRAGPITTGLLVGGSCVTLVGVGLEALWPQAPWLLAVGPVLVVAALAAARLEPPRDAGPAGVPCDRGNEETVLSSRSRP
jgi:hypothetical protein